MALKDLLKILGDVAKQNSIHVPYVVGGIPRDMVLDKIVNLNDIDITTGYDDIHRLADLFAKRLNVSPKIFKDGHKKITYDKYTFDFSSNFIDPDIINILSSIKIKTNNYLIKETYSRDFTINTLLVPLDFSTIIDITKKGLDDCNNKILRCPIDPVLTIKASPNRIIRTIYYAAKYDLTIDPSLTDAIKNNSILLKEVSPKYSTEKISQSLDLKPELLDTIIEIGILHHIPLTTNISDKLIKAKKLLEVIN